MSKRNVRSTSKTQNAKAPGASTSMASMARAPSYDDVARRAYELWIARGAVHGDPMSDWVAAEMELGVRGAITPRA